MASTTGPATRADLLAGLDGEFTVLVRRIRRVIRQQAREVHPDLQIASYLLLAWLANNGPQRGSTVAEQLGIDKGAISRQAQHLEELGLLSRSADPDDGRAMLLAASDGAVARLARMRDERRRTLDERLGDWSEADLASLVSLLGRYNHALEV
ncbi:MarR family winged helix-turn-helix transcriptional regulator [Nocardioides caricicola]|uniref:MarR family winged helix-turn-helix transcriptional regulator n=1 Tax=Nocardioides caricicola TaxID=634770 RepID=A0ABW0N234_9ACTN